MWLGKSTSVFDWCRYGGRIYFVKIYGNVTSKVAYTVKMRDEKHE